MQVYYDPRNGNRYNSRIAARLFATTPDDDFTKYGLHILHTRRPAEYRPKFHTIQDVGVEELPHGYNIQWEIQGRPFNSLKYNLAQDVAAARYEREIGGITWQGYEIDTQRHSQSKLSSKYTAIRDGLVTEDTRWKTKSGFVSFTPQELEDIAQSVLDYVQRCYDAEDLIISDIETLASGEDLSGLMDLYDNLDTNANWPSSEY